MTCFSFIFFSDSGTASGEAVKRLAHVRVREFDRLQGKGLCVEALALS